MILQQQLKTLKASRNQAFMRGVVYFCSGTA